MVLLNSDIYFIFDIEIIVERRPSEVQDTTNYFKYLVRFYFDFFPRHVFFEFMFPVVAFSLILNFFKNTNFTWTKSLYTIVINIKRCLKRHECQFAP